MEPGTLLFGSLDLWVMRSVLELRSPALDAVMHFLLSTDVRIGVLAVLLFYAWITPHGTTRGNETYVLKSLAAIVLAMVACFVARHVLHQQPRPRLVFTELDFPPLNGLGSLMDFRSFPSDTACLAAAIAMAIYWRSRRLGRLAIIWTIAAVSFPRIYIGYHYLSDVVFGIALGAAVALVTLNWRYAIERPAQWLRNVQAKSEPAVMVVAGLIAYQIGTMFPLLQFMGSVAKDYLAHR